MRLVITGCRGQLGTALQAVLAGEELLGVDLPEQDVTDLGRIRKTVCDFRPDVVLHTAALTDVDGCAREPDRAYRVNALGTRNLALACQACDATLLTVSTNEVFDGRKGGEYYEWDEPNPLNPYARSKWAAEWFTQTLLNRFYIVRTAWLYARGGNNFPAKILQAAAQYGRLRVVCDEISSPTYAPDLAAAIARLIRTGVYGIYHFTNEGCCSRYEFARRVLELAGRTDVPVEPITSDQYPRASRVPLHCVLRNFAGAELGIVLRPWEVALEEFFDLGRG